MPDSKSNYKETLKNTTIFGGVQVINIIISLIRGKFVSILLGPIGMGINSLFNSTLNLIKTISGLGLGLSSVRAISESYETKDNDKISRIITIINKLFILTAFIGGLVTLIFSPLLSIWTFGNKDYMWSFIWLSIVVFLSLLSNGQNTILRGMRKITFLVKSTLFGSILGLLTSIPLYYLYGNNGIVPAMVISSITMVLLSFYYSKKIKVKPIILSYKEIYKESTEMVKMGIVLVLAIFIGNLTKFGINVFIGYNGSIGDVGLYAAAIAISSQYIGFILTAISADYFPRLTAVNRNTFKVNKIVNEQIEIVVLLATPLLIIMIFTSPILIKLLLSSEFNVITDFIRFVAIGSFFQVTSYSIGYISFAKNDKYYYLLLEGGLSNLLNFTFSIVSYYFWGLTGLGISFLAIYGIYFFVIVFFTQKKYNFKLTKNTIKLIVTMFFF
jgi:O-antigen/teichoic acid export membrane protein